jgi:hypothetical protein
MQSLDFKVYDADNHIYEPEEAFLRHLPEKVKRDFYFAEINGRSRSWRPPARTKSGIARTTLKA